MSFGIAFLNNQLYRHFYTVLILIEKKKSIRKIRIKIKN